MKATHEADWKIHIHILLGITIGMPVMGMILRQDLRIDLGILLAFALALAWCAVTEPQAGHRHARHTREELLMAETERLRGILVEAGTFVTACANRLQDSHDVIQAEAGGYIDAEEFEEDSAFIQQARRRGAHFVDCAAINSSVPVKETAP